MNKSSQGIVELAPPAMPNKCDDRLDGREGQRSGLRSFLGQAGEPTDVKVSVMLCTDLRRRWENGERVPAEEYLRDDCGLNVETAIDLAYQEFLLREHLGERPSTEEYLRRFPDFAEALGIQIKLHMALGATEKADFVGPSTVNSAVDTRPCAQAWPSIERYTITGELGCGGMGIVYQARQWGLNRTVALKLLKESSQASPDELVRFLGEAEAVAHLQHPNIVQIFDIGEHDEYTFLALEYVGGGS